MEQRPNKKLLQLIIDGKVYPSQLKDKTVKTLLSGGVLLSMQKGEVKECFFNGNPITEKKYIELSSLCDNLGISKPFEIKIVPSGNDPIATNEDQTRGRMIRSGEL